MKLNRNSKLAVVAALLVLAVMFGRYTSPNSLDKKTVNADRNSYIDVMQNNATPIPINITEFNAKATPTIQPQPVPTSIEKVTFKLQQNDVPIVATEHPTEKPEISTSEQKSINNNQDETKETTVYITRTGAKYHSDGCRYLSKSKIPISLNDAKQNYEPCKVCNPPN